jgi:F-type H+-transporting ATPase subunit gamma
MAQIQLIRRRIKSVSNTKQITKAMELVAASKMRRAQEATLRSRPYSTTVKEVLCRLADLPTTQSHPLFQHRPVQTQLAVLMTSDRGLAGAYNSNLFRLLLQTLQSQSAVKTQLIVIGHKGIMFASRLAQTNVEVIGAYPNWPTEPRAADIRPISRTIQNAFESKQVDRVVVLYNKFVSTIRQEATCETVLPFDVAAFTTASQATVQSRIAHDTTVFEPSPDIVVMTMVPRLVEALVFQANLEAIASEQSMRMMAMKNASDNAEELIDDLTLTYNGARQANITQELAEISAGTMAQR